MHVDMFFDHCFNFLSVKTDIVKKDIKLINPGGSKAFKTQIPATRLAMWLNGFEFDVIWAAFQLLLKLHSHILVLWPCKIPVIFGVLVFGYRAQNENPEITESLYFWVYNTNIQVDLLFDHYFYYLSVKTDISKNGVNSIYPEGSKAFKTHISAIWLAIWVKRFEFNVVWTAFQLFLKLNVCISAL